MNIGDSVKIKGESNVLWKNDGGELGEPLTGKADGNPEPSKVSKYF